MQGHKGVDVVDGWLFLSSAHLVLLAIWWCMVRVLRLQSLKNVDHNDGIVHRFINIGTKNTRQVL